jgi:hypothetical protein
MAVCCFINIGSMLLADVLIGNHDERKGGQGAVNDLHVLQ